MSAANEGSFRSPEQWLASRQQRLILSTFGFAVYPTEVDQGRKMCLAVAAPIPSIYPHRSQLRFPTTSIDRIEGSLQAEWNNDTVSIDISGFSVAVSDQPPLSAQAVETPQPPAGKVPPCDHFDFTLIPDFETLCSGVRLDTSWGQSPALQFRFDLAGGCIGGTPDMHTCKEVWSWGLNDGDERLRRVTGTTVYLSDPVASPRLNLTRLGDAWPTGTISLRPDDSGILRVTLVNSAVDASGKYLRVDPYLIDLAHLHAMLTLCTRKPDQEIKAVFGRKVSSGAPASAQSIGQGFKSTSISSALALLEDVQVYYDGDPSCAGRQIPVRRS